MVIPRPLTGLVLSLGALACVAGCTVKDTREDFLRQIFECHVSEDCISGWSCRAFAMDPTQTTYCLQDCAVDADCDFGDVCGTEGFCVEPCDVEGFACRGPDFTCLRKNMMVGATAGYCQPAPTCATYTDCGNIFDWCIADSLSQAAPDLTFAEGHNTCVQGCLGETECEEGYECLKKGLAVHTSLSTEGIPEVCVPKCGPDNRCPLGYRCLTDSLAEYSPANPPTNPALDFCVPGLPGVLLPCTDDAQCLSGLCVEDPESLELYQATYRFCVEPCDDQGECSSVRFECLAGEHDGASGEFCFTRELLNGCEETADCTDPEECMDWSNVEWGNACTVPCGGFRDPICSTGTTCLPTAVPGQFGCFVGYPGMPCNAHDQCHQGYGEQTQCIGTTGQPTDPDRICTKTCTHYSQCTFGPYVGNGGAPLCHAGICQPIAFDCDDPQMPYECNTTMACAEVLGQGQVCTIPCDGLRTTNHACPEQFTCAPLPQSGLSQTEYYCYPGYPGLMPCRADSECLDLRGDSSQRCVSPTGDSLAVDGLCATPCSTDANCTQFHLGVSVCLPGDPDLDAGVSGYCFMNPALEVYLGEVGGLQGSFCEDDADCGDGHVCVDASGSQLSLSNPYGLKFCSRLCPDGTCSQTPVSHACVNAVGPGDVCLPGGPDYARGFWERCLDHRQCADGVCLQPDLSEAGYCTRTCGVLRPCTGYGDPGSGGAQSTCSQNVCQPVDATLPNG